MGQSFGIRGTSKPAKSYNPKMRGAIPKSPIALADTSIENHRHQYNRAINIGNQAANIAAGSYNFGAARPLSYFDGNAAKKINSPAAPKPKFNPDFTPKPNKQRKVQLEAIKGKKRNGGILEGTAVSPLLVTAAKFAATVVVAASLAAFCRVAISTASVTSAIESKDLNSQITEELANKNQLEVEDSAISNSTHLRSAAEQYSLVAPSTIEQINLGQDVVAYDANGTVSLVESLNRVSATK